MRWKKFVGGLALSLTVASGCKQPVFMTEDQADKIVQTMSLPPGIETKLDYADLNPDVTERLRAAPNTVLDPDRPQYKMTLTEAVARALENGTVNGAGVGGPSIASSPSQDEPISIAGLTATNLGAPGASTSDSIRVLALEPAVQQTNIEGALSRFDTHWITSMSWNTTDRPIATAQDILQSGSTTGSIRTQAAELTSSLIKPLPTGGFAGITLDVPYQNTNLQAATNPAYTPSLQFAFEQPLLQGWGVDVNEIRSDVVQSVSGLFPGLNNQPRTTNSGILINRIALNQTRAEFELNVETMKLNVETAYWNLYAAYGQLFAREIALRKNLEVWRLTRERVQAGVKNFTKADEYEAQGQYESSRSDWLGALGNVLDRERILKSLIGLPTKDDRRIVPIDQPTLAAFHPDWATALQEALVLKPELVIEREQLKAQQLNLIDWKNRVMPDLRAFGDYGINSIGNTLSGPDSSTETNALRGLGSDHFNNWTLGLRLDMPIGFRDSNAGLRQARLRLAQMYWKLRTDEDRVEHNLELWYRNVFEYQEQIQRNLAAMTAYNNDLNVRIQRVRGGQETPDVTLQAIRLGSQAMVQYYQFLGQYNSALSHFEFSKGTLLRANNIIIADGPMPECPKVRAVEHEEERANALDLRDRAAAIPCAGPGGCAAPAPTNPALQPELLSLPDWLKTRQPPEQVNDVPPPMPPTTSAPLPSPAPRTLNPLDSGKLPVLSPAPTATPTVLPALPPVSITTPTPTTSLPGTTTSYGRVQPINFGDDRTR